MNRSGANGSGSGCRPVRLDRARRLLSFDLSFLNAFLPEHGPPRPHDQVALSSVDSDWVLNGVPPDVRLVGFDEAGRGSLAGPVTVGCVSFEWSRLIGPTGDLRADILEAFAFLNDSKQVTPLRRETLHTRIQADARWSVGCASAVEIDRLGIVKACRRAVVRAFRGLGGGGSERLAIGLFDRGLSLGEEEGESISSAVQVTHGDAQSFHIAAASILAKVSRDAIMRELGKRASLYGFADHKGYGTAAHFDAIRRHGPSKFHRRSFLS